MRSHFQGTRDRHRAAECLHPLGQADGAGPLSGVGSPDAVVSNREVEIGALGFDAYLHHGGSGVFGDVGQCFGDDVIGADFD